jgi:predicted RNA-binding protein
MAVKKNIGGERLLPRSEWPIDGALHGTDEDVLCHPVMIRAQEAIIQQFKPASRVAFLSLCTSTRPYSKGKKWSTFIEQIPGVDHIVCSNGGIIPLEFESEFPYLTYDAHGQAEFDGLYILFTDRNMIRFFVAKRYEYIVFNFRPNLRNSRSAHMAGQYLKARGHVKGYAVIPDERLYDAAHADGFDKHGCRMFSDLHPWILKALKEQAEKYLTS